MMPSAARKATTHTATPLMNSILMSLSAGVGIVRLRAVPRSLVASALPLLLWSALGAEGLLHCCLESASDELGHHRFKNVVGQLLALARCRFGW